MKIKFATMTGPNDLTNRDELTKIHRDFPFVEWGILISQSQTGSARFPTHKWIQHLLEIVGMNYSVHVCGKWVRDICGGNYTIPDDVLWRRFQRMQLNFHANAHLVTPNFFNLLRNMNSKHEFILQLDGVNDHILTQCLSEGVKAVPIFDLSGGAGILPSEWPKPVPGIVCTYAGGLGPDNLEEQLKKIADVVGDAEICIDMETRVRSEDDVIFDLGKVVRALEISAKYT